MTLFLGIDPGFDGALAVLDDDGKLLAVHDTPTLEVRGGAKKKRMLDISAMEVLLRNHAHETDGEANDIAVALEDVHAMPKQGAVSSFAFGRGLGVWEGLLCAFGMSINMVSPQKWKKSMMAGMGTEKDASRVVALRLFPKAELHLKKHHGRADAILMAEWLRRTCNGRV